MIFYSYNSTLQYSTFILQNQPSLVLYYKHSHNHILLLVNTPYFSGLFFLTTSSLLTLSLANFEVAAKPPGFSSDSRVKDNVLNDDPLLIFSC